MTSTSYPQFAAELRQTIRHQEDEQSLNEGCRSRFWLQDRKTERVVLFFHGFTACPEQFDSVGPALYDLGYNVVAPLQPGHGCQGDWGADQPPPLSDLIEPYLEFAEHWLRQAQALGEQVIVSGLSSGGTLAAWLAFTHAAEVERAMLYAPYLGSSPKVLNWAIEAAKPLDHLIYLPWLKAPDTVTQHGYPGFRLSALQIFLDLGREVLQLAQTQRGAPLLLVSSESDWSASNSEHQALFENAVQAQPHSWYACFDQKLKVPHTMMREVDGNDYEYLLISLTRAYLQSDFTSQELQQLAAEVKQGRSLEQVLAERGWLKRLTPDLPVVLQQLSLDPQAQS
ncbi:carboxylesterase [Leptolyngbya sp. FACHB-261]|uniref:alpha/beta hydrolase n=1 Tax=Leptolyngbya sp. FACHB-261 TaxID=2692806 RepID=UPI0016829B2A|nr:alpha/beta fold hydrolase [Leptolyngbya sp. FACHB-261]MBD2103116.1 alpha/beta fold hydrolase [Leptolyngbya sp. FACHB-261]